MTTTPYNATRTLELLRLGKRNAAARFREGQEEAIRHIVEGLNRVEIQTRQDQQDLQDKEAKV